MRHSRALPAKARRRESQGVFGARRVGVGMAWPQTGWRGRPAQRRPPLSPSSTSAPTSAGIGCCVSLRLCVPSGSQQLQSLRRPAGLS